MLEGEGSGIDGTPAGGKLLVISDGGENSDPRIKDVIPLVGPHCIILQPHALLRTGESIQAADRIGWGRGGLRKVAISFEARFKSTM